MASRAPLHCRWFVGHGLATSEETCVMRLTFAGADAPIASMLQTVRPWRRDAQRHVSCDHPGVMEPQWRAKAMLVTLAIALLLSTSGCLTDKTLMAAQGYSPSKETSAATTEEPKEKPAYRALLPFAVLGDIALAPFYFGLWVYCVTTGHID